MSAEKGNKIMSA